MIRVLRLNHRRERDKRMTMHVALAARAFGADEFVLTGDKDNKLLENIRSVVDRFGGGFHVFYSGNWKKEVKDFEGTIVHLTMYGERVHDRIKEIRKRKRDLMVIVGGAKVPPEIYELSDYNIGVTNQPHSEVSALAVFLDKYHNSRELNHVFTGGKVEIVPRKRVKDVKEL